MSQIIPGNTPVLAMPGHYGETLEMAHIAMRSGIRRPEYRICKRMADSFRRTGDNVDTWTRDDIRWLYGMFGRAYC